jgi:hypothetical protein
MKTVLYILGVVAFYFVAVVGTIQAQKTDGGKPVALGKVLYR